MFLCYLWNKQVFVLSNLQNQLLSEPEKYVLLRPAFIFSLLMFQMGLYCKSLIFVYPT